MTTLIVSPQVSQLKNALAVAPDLAACVRAAQHAGDLAYAFAERSGVALPERAVAYHVAFADTMRELLQPVMRGHGIDLWVIMSRENAPDLHVRKDGSQQFLSGPQNELWIVR